MEPGIRFDRIVAEQKDDNAADQKGSKDGQNGPQDLAKEFHRFGKWLRSRAVRLLKKPCLTNITETKDSVTCKKPRKSGALLKSNPALAYLTTSNSYFIMLMD